MKKRCFVVILGMMFIVATSISAFAGTEKSNTEIGWEEMYRAIKEEWAKYGVTYTVTSRDESRVYTEELKEQVLEDIRVRAEKSKELTEAENLIAEQDSISDSLQPRVVLVKRTLTHTQRVVSPAYFGYSGVELKVVVDCDGIRGTYHGTPVCTSRNMGDAINFVSWDVESTSAKIQNGATSIAASATGVLTISYTDQLIGSTGTYASRHTISHVF